MSSLKNITFSSLNKIKLPSNLTNSQLSSLKSLSSDKNIVIRKPDKGNGVVILNKSEYISKMNLIINENTNLSPLIKISLNL